MDPPMKAQGIPNPVFEQSGQLSQQFGSLGLPECKAFPAVFAGTE